MPLFTSARLHALHATAHALVRMLALHSTPHAVMRLRANAREQVGDAVSKTQTAPSGGYDLRRATKDK